MTYPYTYFSLCEDGGTQDYGFDPQGDPVFPLVSDFTPSIVIGDFTIEALYMVSTLYNQALTANPTEYVIVGQYDGVFWDGSGIEPSYWQLALIVNPSGSAYYEFSAWDQSTQTELINIHYDVTIPWSSEWSTTNTKTNTATSPDNIAVVRNGNTVTLYVNGQSSASSIGTLTSNLPTDTTVLIINGDISTIPDPTVPYSPSYISELVITKEAKYSGSSYTTTDYLFQEPGLIFFPRVSMNMMVGAFGDTRSKLVFSPRISPVLDVPTYVHGNFSFTPRISSVLELQWDIGEDFGDIGINLPIYKCSINTAINEFCTLKFDLPIVEFYSTAINSEFADINFSLPLITTKFDIVINEIATIDFSIPFLDIDINAIFNETAIINFNIPIINTSINAIVGVTGIINFDIPIYNISIISIEDITGNIICSIPIFTTEFISSIVTNDKEYYNTLVYNLKNSALTLFNNYNFNSMCSFGGKHFSADSTNIYDIDSGDTDNGEELEWSFTLPYLDLEQRTKKKLLQAWVSYKSEDQITVTIIQPDGTEYEYDLENINDSEDGQRVKFGKGINSKYLSLKFNNTTGNSLCLDAINLALVNLKTGR